MMPNGPWMWLGVEVLLRQTAWKHHTSWSKHGCWDRTPPQKNPTHNNNPNTFKVPIVSEEKETFLTCFSYSSCCPISSSMMSCRWTGWLRGLVCWLRVPTITLLTGKCCCLGYDGLVVSCWSISSSTKSCRVTGLERGKACRLRALGFTAPTGACCCCPVYNGLAIWGVIMPMPSRVRSTASSSCSHWAKASSVTRFTRMKIEKVASTH